MTTWADLGVGDLAIHDDREHEIVAIKPVGKSLKVVLQPVVDTGELAAKIAMKVEPEDRIAIPEATEDGEVTAEADRATSVIESVLGGVQVADIDDEGELTIPLINTTTVAAHLKIIHGTELTGLAVETEDEFLRIHQELHDAPFHEPKHAHTHEGGM